ncbi:MAG: translation initiation factor [Chitinophagales bacterium]|nr:translation initiation factor [Chitinophagales bacterium]
MSKNDKNWKERLGTVYSTNPDFNYEYENDIEEETLENNKQLLYIYKDNKQRKGKVVTIVDNFIGTTDDLNDLAKFLKTKCGVGGAVKDGQIIIQGDLKDKIKTILEQAAYKTKLK